MLSFHLLLIVYLSCSFPGFDWLVALSVTCGDRNQQLPSATGSGLGGLHLRVCLCLDSSTSSTSLRLYCPTNGYLIWS